MAEAIFRHHLQTTCSVFSAGSEPAKQPYPAALDFLKTKQIAVDDLHSKSLDTVPLDQIRLMVTVCDSAAEACVYLSLPDAVRVHCGLPDPSRLQGAAQSQTFETVYRQLDSLAVQTGQWLETHKIDEQIKSLFALSSS